MSNFSGPTNITNSIGTFAAAPTLNLGEVCVVLSSDGRSATLALPGNTMAQVNTVTTVVKPPVGKQEVYTTNIKLVRAMPDAATVANPTPRITLSLEAKIPKGAAAQDITDAVYDLYCLLAQGKVHKTLFVDGVALRP